MSRQIKFRVFSERFKENKMLAVTQMTVGEDGTWFHAYRDESGGRAFHESSGKVMQFTGLKDKNSVEVFEGDILLDPYRIHGHQHIVVFYSDNCSMFMIRNEPRTWSESLDGVSDRITVIGNIYENPELLETK